MKISDTIRRLTPRTAGVALIGVLMAALAATAGPALASGAGGMSMSGANAGFGNTKGWFQGSTVSLHYTKDFFCRKPPRNKARSNCEVGAQFRTAPKGPRDPLFVVVPLGFTPKRSTLQCPTAGRCVDHPRTISLARVLGPGTGNALLPPHSHLITDLANGRSEWWGVSVIGVSSPKVWNQIVLHKSYAIVQFMRKHHNKHITANIPTNLFLYFSAH
ncbi:MAG: hypothetical protein ACRDP1_11465 [Nocardioidaceae bacterium]